MLHKYHPRFEESYIRYYINDDFNHYSATIQDKTTEEYIALTVLSQQKIDTKEFKLL